ncbi:ECF transporter S component [Fervidicoccus fontis]|jgi:energy-coupling factor transport system substrate-specific component|uniref:ABC transporter, permease protein n=2 Tax=Fervidicoccus fontis TaxID=683846 RepID=I0A0R2_FERFK|nr:ECF transporter S component [Fervidicoccus fontis]AFH42569.1 ABC transporter, permease protein [Fervidicoccus fontis Kam940]MBE9391177.1 ECF transporter S component [Fervidicoccus fontis]PMB75677.1 MAG: ABC transporter permease [Fervidicoccus fontis]PMB78169.1 MAG: ABC transporter permease [Fervidicoccus fontis]HEW64023.1 ABC transporter permease [Fervidicoccus fontis]
MNSAEKKEKKKTSYTGIDLAILALVGVVTGIIFAGSWSIYYAVEAVGGPVGARLASYGLWFIGAPLAATLIRKPLSALFGEVIGAFVETLIAPAGGITNIIYGLLQGLASEFVYFLFRYKRWDIISGVLSAIAAGPVAVALDALLFGTIGSSIEMSLWVIASMVSGAVYGFIATYAAKSIRRNQ